ncbi:unnamed protein product [Dovyalis caffra]|uniref:Uncharacterized protein n=1 Tax=Dovyalis caffra TaxID=77055 RepID=A0AAV1SFM6_9ROSI|nr:unnamed protein product [Dovyalis caffra]
MSGKAERTFALVEPTNFLTMSIINGIINMLRSPKTYHPLVGNPSSMSKGLDVKKWKEKSPMELRICGVKKKERKEYILIPMPGSVSLMIFFGSGAMEVRLVGQVR